MEDHTDLQSARSVLHSVAAWSKLSGQGVAVAAFAGFDAEGRFLVTLGDGMTPVQALSTVGLAPGDAGAAIVVAFEQGEVRHPVIVGRVQPLRTEAPPALDARVDGERVVLQGRERIELRCGEASIVLTRAGKVLINGNYVLTRSRGANRVKGAYVGIN
ncbi:MULTISPECIES: DUF6484 domain-containing protein [Variovorax]|uniref:DUF6484 domain-containing protein n=1 Tax=Variovorax TaxID=34072 RepID=UPI000898F79E|nr:MULTISPECIES: DUF6484 domain-containing protein [unclassified Variovorax]SDZ16303.1 hypothetical protein SAMN05518854_10467 [Variovorax sp. YR266]SET58464.1 hypothetical protein SAMN05443580_104405 [Variovorax sp. OV084]